MAERVDGPIYYEQNPGDAVPMGIVSGLVSSCQASRDLLLKLYRAQGLSDVPSSRGVRPPRLIYRHPLNA